MTLFILSGSLAALAGVIEASRIDAGDPNAGSYLVLDAISAAVLGGVNLFGGIGTVPGIFLGALLLVSIQNGLSLMGVSNYLELIASGLILLGAVSLDALSRLRSVE